MKEIYYLLLVVLTAIGSSFITLHVDKVKRVLKRLFTRKKRQATYVWGKHKLSLPQILDLIERRLELIDKRDKQWLDLQDRVDNLEKSLRTRETSRDKKVKKIVVEYLKELQK